MCLRILLLVQIGVIVILTCLQNKVVCIVVFSASLPSLTVRFHPRLRTILELREILAVLQT